MSPRKAAKPRQHRRSKNVDPVKLDKQHTWHPFTQMKEWCSRDFESIVIVKGKGATLTDHQGKTYLDGNASIWTNLHGHRHPRMDAAIRRQLGRIAHSSFLGLTNDLAPRLAAELVEMLRSPEKGYRVFFSDDGSTAMEAALKMAVQARRQRGETRRKRFVSLAGGYHGDTVGAMSLGHSPLFHAPYRDIMFKTRAVSPSGCYRCPFNRAKPVQGRDQRQGRQCAWECLEVLRQALDDRPETVNALVMEPLVQGAAGMQMYAPGFLRHAAEMCRQRGIWLILDEVMTGCGRTGTFFACQREAVLPDFIALAKGLTGGYLPLAATLASGEVYDAFLGDYAEFKTFFHGHSYTGNPLGCAAAQASLAIFRDDKVLKHNAFKARWLENDARIFWRHPNIGDVRQEGLICAIELVEEFDSRKPFPPSNRLGFTVCQAARRHGLLTRPIGDVLVLMPPYCTTRNQMRAMVKALWSGLCEVLPLPKNYTK